MPKIARTNKLPFERRRWKEEHKHSSFYNSTIWRKVRKGFIASNPVCAGCKSKGKRKFGRVVDHIIRIKDGGAKLDFRNMQTLCDVCHNKKSAIEKHRNLKIKSERNHLNELIPVNKAEILKVI